jgi:small nuclear ribonucleoprotein D3
MSVTGRNSIGVPVVLLSEGQGFFVNVETKSNELYHGLLFNSEDNFNLHLKNVSYTSASGKRSKLEEVFIRGSQVRFIILPDALAHAPIFRRVARFKDSKRKIQFSEVL